MFDIRQGTADTTENTQCNEAAGNRTFSFYDFQQRQLQDSLALNSMPLAYALKGRCLSNSELRYLINKVRNTLHERKIRVLCEIYDGQWQYTIMHDEDDNPLNRLRVSTGTWSRISKLSKIRILDELMTITSLKLGDIDLLRLSTFRQGMNT